jgi:hypothetical protein
MRAGTACFELGWYDESGGRIATPPNFLARKATAMHPCLAFCTGIAVTNDSFRDGGFVRHMGHGSAVHAQLAMTGLARLPTTLPERTLLLKHPNLHVLGNFLLQTMWRCKRRHAEVFPTYPVSPEPELVSQVATVHPEQ